MTELVSPQTVLAVRSVLQPARPPATEIEYPPAVTVNTQRCRPLLSSCSMACHSATPYLHVLDLCSLKKQYMHLSMSLQDRAHQTYAIVEIGEICSAGRGAEVVEACCSPR